jgi:succinyl-CoA synthetase beta subunit
MCLRELDTIEKKIDAIEDKVDSLSETVNQIVKERMLEDHKHDLAIQSLEIRVGLIGAGAGVAVPTIIELIKFLIAR